MNTTLLPLSRANSIFAAFSIDFIFNVVPHYFVPGPLLLTIASRFLAESDRRMEERGGTRR